MGPDPDTVPDPNPCSDPGTAPKTERTDSKSGFRILINFLWIRIRMDANPDTDPDPIQQLKKKLNFFLSKTTNYLSLGLHKVCPGYRRSLQLTKEAIQHFKT